MLSQTIGFLGAGKMGQALIRGMLATQLVSPQQILACDLSEARQAEAAALGIGVVEDNARVVRESDVVVVALKPGIVRAELPRLAKAIRHDKLVVSIAAGVTLPELEGMLLPEARVVRVMPNTPCQVGAGASAFSLGSSATADDADLVNHILTSVGISVGPLAETLLDAVTGLSGSGPAYVALVIEALADGGVLCGLSRDMALKLAAQTVVGTARLVLEAEIHPAKLKDMVASPGGTTIEGIQVLEEHGLRAALIAAVEAATLKAEELGRG
ncbi:MAG: pyrroline-5-carboxylate reductase [Candidatus Brocadiae bacterium]|nr:pyrroline-5-carboxylate reductase [Candidatus Brocadiia bacterium]